MTLGIGIIEGFFGPEWSWSDRQSVCDLLSQQKNGFYIYAPKRDAYLRKNWMQIHPLETSAYLKQLSEECRKKKVKFGVGLSPFEVHTHWDSKAQGLLRDKVLALEDLGLDVLGLFFDDMRGSDDLAAHQAEIVEFVRRVTKTNLLFCPTYYSLDPILDKVFGQRHAEYLSYIGRNISLDVSVLWTGNKVISDSITAADLESIGRVLNRKPFIWDNYFANDGPKQCKFLKLKPLLGRDEKALNQSAGWAFNLMNQANLSKIVYKASAKVLLGENDPQNALQSSIIEMAGAEQASILLNSKNDFLEKGLDGLTPQFKQSIRLLLDSKNLYSGEVINWLDGKYLVGAECLTD